MTNWNIEIFGGPISCAISTGKNKSVHIEGIGVLDKIIDPDGCLHYLVLQIQVVGDDLYDAVSDLTGDLVLVWRGCRVPVRNWGISLDEYEDHNVFWIKLEVLDDS